MDGSTGVFVVVLAATPLGAECTPTATEQARIDCLKRPTVLTLSGGQPEFGRTEAVTIPSGSAINAVDAYWNNVTAGATPIQGKYPVGIRYHGSTSRRDLCFAGGAISTSFATDEPWSFWHDTTALVIETPDFELIGTRISNVGDGVDFERLEATNWTMRGVYVTGAHDDCVENDEMNSGLVDDSFLDGCHVGFSARRWGEDGHLYDGGANTMTITNSLVRLQASAPYAGPAPGHGGFFKFSSAPLRGRSPKLAIHDTIFRADQAPNYYHLGIPGFDHDDDRSTPSISYLDEADCSGNVVVWLGGDYNQDGDPTDFPGRDLLPASCFTVTDDPAVWDRAAAAWHADHPAP